MEYCGFSINLDRQRIYEELSIMPMYRDGYASKYSSRKDSKEALASTARLEVDIEGYRIVKSEFLFELRTILEDFASKRLGEYKPGQPINTIAEVFADGEGDVFIERVDSQLIIKHTFDYIDMAILVALNVISAKTLASILGKALQLADFQ